MSINNHVCKIYTAQFIIIIIIICIGVSCWSVTAEYVYYKQ